MKNLLHTLLALMLGALLVLPQPVRADDAKKEPTLEETVAFIKKMLSTVSTVYSENRKSSHSSLSVEDFQGTTLTIKKLTETDYEDGSGRTNERVYTFSLALLDPEMTSHTSKQTQIFSTNDEKIIRCAESETGWGTDKKKRPPKNETSYVSNYSFWISDEPSDVPGRLANAFKNAITLCGGKQSKKDPF